MGSSELNESPQRERPLSVGFLESLVKEEDAEVTRVARRLLDAQRAAETSVRRLHGLLAEVDGLELEIAAGRAVGDLSWIDPMERYVAAAEEARRLREDERAAREEEAAARADFNRLGRERGRAWLDEAAWRAVERRLREREFESWRAEFLDALNALPAAGLPGTLLGRVPRERRRPSRAGGANRRRGSPARSVSSSTSGDDDPPLAARLAVLRSALAAAIRAQEALQDGDIRFAAAILLEAELDLAAVLSEWEPR